MKQKKITLLVAATIVALSTSCNNNDMGENRDTRIRVNSEVINLSEEVKKRNYIGIVEEESAISVSFTGSGTIAKVCVTEGQKVKKGEIIAEIDKTQAQNMLSMAQAQMTQANDAYKRLKQLYDNKSLPDMEWIEVQSKVQQAEASLEIAKKTLADCSICSPENGIVGNGVMSVGEVALPALPVATILVIDNVKIRASIPEKEIASIKSSTKSTIKLGALPNQFFEGGKIEKCIEANGMTHTYDIKINVTNTNHQLLPGMVANIELSNSVKNGVITVPITSVRKNTQGANYIWCIENGTAQMREITVGESSGDRIIVSNGLEIGDTIVTQGYQKLSEGVEVYK